VQYLGDDITVAITCGGDPRVLRALASVPAGVPIVVSLTPSPDLRAKLVDAGVEVVDSVLGNISVSHNLELSRVRTRHVFWLDSDCVLQPGCLEKVNAALADAPFARARVKFASSRAVWGSRATAYLRELSNNRTPPPAYTPGLGARVGLEQDLGGWYFDERVPWTEDSELGHRLERLGFSLAWADDAIVVHDPISVGHEIRSAFRIGRGVRTQVDAGLRPPHERLAIALPMLASAVRRTLSKRAGHRSHPRLSPLIGALRLACALSHHAGYRMPRAAARLGPATISASAFCPPRR